MGYIIWPMTVINCANKMLLKFYSIASLIFGGVMLLILLHFMIFFTSKTFNPPIRPKATLSLSPYKGLLDAQFDQRLRVAFPPGTAVSKIKKALKAKGFELDETKARYDDWRFLYFCRDVYWVHWEEDKKGSVRSITGLRDLGCFS